MLKPISPSEIKPQPIPDEVIEVFNALITHHYDLVEGKAHIPHPIAEAALRAKFSYLRNPWFKIAPFYEAQGWNVTVDGVGYHFLAKQ